MSIKDCFLIVGPLPYRPTTEYNKEVWHQLMLDIKSRYTINKMVNRCEDPMWQDNRISHIKYCVRNGWLTVAKEWPAIKPIDEREWECESTVSI